MKKLSMTLLLACTYGCACCMRNGNDKEEGKTLVPIGNTMQVKQFQLSMSLATSQLKYRKTLKK